MRLPEVRLALSQMPKIIQKYPWLIRTAALLYGLSAPIIPIVSVLFRYILNVVGIVIAAVSVIAGRYKFLPIEDLLSEINEVNKDAGE